MWEWLYITYQTYKMDYLIKSKLSINVLIFAFVIFALLCITFVNVESYCRSGIFKINLFGNAKQGGLFTTISFLFILSIAYFGERKKLISLKVFKEKVIISGLFYTEQFDRNKIVLEEKTITPNLSTKYHVIVLNSKYVISEFYISNYKEIRDLLQSASSKI